jgi:S1-C subfamily serine protease
MIFLVMGILAGLLLCRSASIPFASAAAAVQGQTASASAAIVGETPNESPGSGLIENSVVKVFATLRLPDLEKPWNKQAGREVTGSGLVIEGRRILTNAHVVLHAGLVQIQGNKSGDKISATVEAVAPGIDLAILKLSDESFFNTHNPLPFTGDLPKASDSVTVYGFPTGGSSLSITKGIVSRIEFAPYNYPVSGLRIQIDAAINPGNSGGPAIVGDKVAGLAFSVLARTQNIGYIIPCEEIELFLKDIADGHYDGKPAVFDEFQTMENPALRAFLKLDKSINGIVVHVPFQTDPSYPLRQWDVVTKIGDVPVDDQGNIMRGDNLKISFSYLVQKIAKNGKVPLTIVRKGSEMPIQLPVSPFNPKLIPFLQGKYPSYFICGPLVFSVASEELIAAISNASTGTSVINYLSLSDNPLFSRRGDRPAFEGEELVMAPSPLFSHPLAKNYSSPQLKVVKTINGIAVKNLRHLVEIIRDSKDEFIIIEFVGRGGEALIFPRKDMIAATDEVLTDNGIRTQGSVDVMAVWNTKPR